MAIGAAAADQPEPAVSRAARQRPGAVRRARRGLLHRRQRAVRRRSRRRSRFVRMDGETPSPSGSRGQVFVLDGSARRRARRHPPAGLRRRRAAADRRRRRHRPGHHPRHRPRRLAALPAQGDQRGAGQLPQDRARQDRRGRRPAPRFGRLPRACRPTFAPGSTDGSITRIKVIGQGTAAVAGRSMAAVLDTLADGALDVDPITATELSGFGMRLDMSDTLVIAVSQSGTTTDTNRTVDLVRGRGAAVLGIVNRRNSDLTDKADGVMYTSDGRDVEMSVASTKAFYAQVAAGVLLACAITEAAERRFAAAPPRSAHLAARDARGDARRAVAPRRRSPRPRDGSRRRSATGRSSATAPTPSPPKRCGSSSASCATSRSPATSPRTRSTSTCRASR